MSHRTDSEIVEYNEDGSWTTTTTVTEYPLTTAQKATAWGVLGAVAVLPFVPLVALIVHEKFEEKREARRRAKQEKKDN